MEDQPNTGRRKLVLVGIAALTALVMGGLVILSPSGASDLATVKALEPTVRLQQPKHNVFRPITAPTSTNEGARVETDKTGMAEIAYFDASLSRIGPESEYELSTLEDERSHKAIVGDLDVGRTYHRVTELTGSEDRFEVRTPNAVAAVRGTRFIVVCLPNGECTFGVIDGVVEIASRSTSEVCVVRPGEALDVQPDVDCSAIRPLDLDDPWISLNLSLDGVDLEELRKRLFGDDRLPATDDDPSSDEVDGDGDGESDVAASRRGSAGGGAPGGGPGGPPPSGVLGEVVDRPGGPPPGESPPSTDRPGQGSTTTSSTQPRRTTTTRPGEGSTTTTRPGQGSTSTTRPGQGSTTTTTRPRGTTSTTRDCTTGYPPRPC